MIKSPGRLFKHKSFSLLIAVAFLATQAISSVPSIASEVSRKNYDVVIYGGTPSAVAAAISVSNAGHSALIISDRPTIGGAISNGLGAADVRAKFAVTGISGEFFHRVQGFYKDPNMWNVEPRVAERIFRTMVRGQNIEVVTNAKLESVDTQDNRITCANVKWSKQFCGQVFIDASYTNDLVDLAQVPTNLGPSDLYTYDEPEARSRYFTQVGDFSGYSKVRVYNAMKNNPFITKSDVVPQGKELLTSGTPSWNYRLCLSKKHMRPFKRWPGYYQLVPSWRVLASAIHVKKMVCVYECLRHPKKPGRATLVHIVKLPNGKFDLNAGTSQISNFPIPREYFTNPQSRTEIETSMRRYLESYLYFVQHDATVPRSDQKKLKGLGLCADEFTGNHNWPYAPYIREGRRLIGKSTLTTNDILRARTNVESVAIGSYSLDTKSSQVIYAEGAVYRDIGKFINPSVYEIPYSALVPASGPTNLLSSVNISTSPTAFGSVRMEAQFMEIGQAAGTAASIALERSIPVDTVHVNGLRARLWRAGLVTSIKVLCEKLPKRDRPTWQFNRSTCEITHEVD